jgi:hypothetical protein
MNNEPGPFRLAGAIQNHQARSMSEETWWSVNPKNEG